MEVTKLRDLYIEIQSIAPTLSKFGYCPALVVCTATSDGYDYHTIHGDESLESCNIDALNAEYVNVPSQDGDRVQHYQSVDNKFELYLMIER